MNIAITSAEFSFNNVVLKQIDGVAMDSPLGPAPGNILAGYYENKEASNWKADKVGIYLKVKGRPAVFVHKVFESFSFQLAETGISCLSLPVCS